ncbi:uncharacterized protein METZ01_LOCUS290235 [marine metagenome]|uniref:NTP pyrophosphohydrolase MazG putative catalytic core domain-containing protein n=1 Tax=marine metagenome TaxID=408172 RepID=A0A382LR75_9ZZZZ
MQGYKPNEYEVLDQSDDINYISDKEIELQKSYGYKVDRKLYKNLFNIMRINVTEQTSTFACPLNQLQGYLEKNIGLEWKTSHGTFQLNAQTNQWILDNAKMSMYNDNRSYVYNKAFAEYFKSTKEIKCEKKPLKIFQQIRDWAQERGLYKHGDVNTQYIKLQEEAGELAKALLENDQLEVIDAIGDMVVVLTNLAHQRGVHIETCIAEAYKVISKRKGKMINGTFVKDEE